MRGVDVDFPRNLAKVKKERISWSSFISSFFLLPFLTSFLLSLKPLLSFSCFSLSHFPVCDCRVVYESNVFVDSEFQLVSLPPSLSSHQSVHPLPSLSLLLRPFSSLESIFVCLCVPVCPCQFVSLFVRVESFHEIILNVCLSVCPFIIFSICLCEVLYLKRRTKNEERSGNSIS